MEVDVEHRLMKAGAALGAAGGRYGKVEVGSRVLEVGGQSAELEEAESRLVEVDVGSQMSKAGG